MKLANIVFDKAALIHTYRRHHLTTTDIHKAIRSGVKVAVEDSKNDSILVFTNSKIALALTKENHLKSAFYYRHHYYVSKTNTEKKVEL